jgi:transmembrane sensor
MWFAHLHSGRETPEDWTAFDEWRAASPEHQRAGVRAKRIWDQIGTSLLQQYKSKLPKIPKLPIIVLGVIGFSALAFFGGAFGPPQAFFADHRSATGEVRSVVLRDGSEVDLDTSTSFDVSDGDRTITLYTGQIYIKVKPDPARAFTVISGRARTQALGTAFAVRRDGKQSRVVVTESAVRVGSSQPGGPNNVRVDAGSTVAMRADGHLSDPQLADVAALTAWRHGQLKFVDRPLGEVIAELDRYRGGKILIFGNSIKSLSVTGSVDIAKLDQFLFSLEVIMPVRVIQLPGVVVIRPLNIL